MRQGELPAPTSRVLSASPAPQCRALAAPSRGAVGEAATLRCEERSRDIRGIFRKTKCSCNYRVETSNPSPRICSQTAVMALQEEEEGELARGDHKTSTRTLHKVSWMPVFVLFRNQVAWILTFIAWILLFFFFLQRVSRSLRNCSPHNPWLNSVYINSFIPCFGSNSARLQGILTAS